MRDNFVNNTVEAEAAWKAFQRDLALVDFNSDYAEVDKIEAQGERTCIAESAEVKNELSEEV